MPSKVVSAETQASTSGMISPKIPLLKAELLSIALKPEEQLYAKVNDQTLSSVRNWRIAR